MARKATIPVETKKKKEAASVSLDEVQAANTQKKAREDKRNDKLTEDLMYGKKAHERTLRDTMAERDKKGARLHDFGRRHDVMMIWDLNQDCIRDQIFVLRVGRNEVFLSAVEIQKYLRWV